MVGIGTGKILGTVCSMLSNSQTSLCTYVPTNNLSFFISPIGESKRSKTPYIYNKVRARRFMSMMLMISANVFAAAQDNAGVQLYDVKSSSCLAFPVSQSQLKDDFGGNRQEMENLNTVLGRLSVDTTAQVRRVVVCGYGSPDGPSSFNENLAKRRADAMLARLMKVGGSKLPKNIIELRYVAEDWEGLGHAVESTSLEQMPNREKVLSVIRGLQSADAKERILRRQYPADFRYLVNNVLPQLRRSEYCIEYTTRNLPDESLATISVGTASSVPGGAGSSLPGGDGSSLPGGAGSSVPGGAGSSVPGGAASTASGGAVTAVSGGAASATKSRAEVTKHENADSLNVASNVLQNVDNQQIDKLRMWRWLLGGLLLLVMLAAGFMIYRLFSTIRDKDDAIDRLQKQVRMYRDAALRGSREAAVAAVAARPRPVVSSGSETTVANAEPETKPETVPLAETKPVAEIKPESVPMAEIKPEPVPVVEREPETKSETVPVVEAAPETPTRTILMAPVAAAIPETEAKTEADNNNTITAAEAGADAEAEAAVVAEIDDTDDSEVDDSDNDDVENDALQGFGEQSSFNTSEVYERFQKMDREVKEKRLYLDGNLNRRQLMRIAGVDKNRFAAMMRQFAGTNFAGYINAKRMEYAKQLISEHPEYTMKTVGELCGFNSQSTFFRVFKSVYGITPIELSQTGKSRERADNQTDSVVSKSPSGQNDNSKELVIRFDSSEN